MTESNSEDELKALIALGVLASIAVLFQLLQSNAFPFTFNPPNLFIQNLEIFMAFIILALFTGYLVFITLAIGFEGVGWRKFSNIPRRLADYTFLLGALALAIGVALVILRIIVPP